MDGSPEMSLNRRTFLRTAAAAGAAAPLASGADSAEAKPRKLAIPINKLPKLKTVGGWTIAKIRKWKILFVRTSATEIKALSPYCTHRKCLVAYDAPKHRLECGCHGSKFTLAGKVLTGPATRPLPVFPAWLKGDRIIVQVPG